MITLDIDVPDSCEVCPCCYVVRVTRAWCCQGKQSIANVREPRPEWCPWIVLDSGEEQKENSND